MNAILVLSLSGRDDGGNYRRKRSPQYGAGISDTQMPSRGLASRLPTKLIKGFSSGVLIEINRDQLILILDLSPYDSGVPLSPTMSFGLNNCGSTH